jgi:hypothetical protein
MCRGGGGCEVCTGAEVGTAAGAAGAGGLTLKELSTKRIWLPEGAHSQLIPCCWHLPQVGWIRSHLICQYSGDTVIIIGHRRSKSLNACLYYTPFYACKPDRLKRLVDVGLLQTWSMWDSN